MHASVRSIFILCVCLLNTVIGKYTFTGNQNNAAKYNIYKVGSNKIDDLEVACDSLGGQCAGFDTYGNLKSSTAELAYDPNGSFYSKVAGPPLVPLPERLWPLPQKYTRGQTAITLTTPFSFKSNITSPLLQRAFNRYQDLIFTKKTKKSPQVGIDTLLVNVASTDETLQLETDESYILVIPTNSNPTISAQTIYGALHGLETFSQLVRFEYDSKSYKIHDSPWTIVDFPRFPHRGILIDSSRHFLPVGTVKKVIDSLSYAKVNVLHWHLVDCQSFPVESVTFPKLWEGSWSKNERYTLEELTDIVQYAQDRGVRVMPEFDGPGHMFSWGVGYPELLPTGYAENDACEAVCPVNPCDVPIDPSNPKTYEVLEAFFGEMTGGKQGAGVFPSNLLHLGGDEVEAACWSQSPSIQAFMLQNNFTDFDQLYMYYIQKAHDIAESDGRVVVNWEEVFNHFGNKLNPNTIIHIWLDHATLSKVVDAGYRGILSNYDDWYLDDLGNDWVVFYQNDPLENISLSSQHLVLGGETCMWGESVDPSDIFARIWPRAAAVAEVLWNYEVAGVGNAIELAVPRLHNFRCQLLERGIDAAPLNGFAPVQPGSCYVS